MADRPSDDIENLDDVEEGPADEGRILAPEELDISESEYVEELDEGRFVVSPDGPPSVGPRESDQSTSSQSRNQQPDRSRDESDGSTQQSRPSRRQEDPSQPAQEPQPQRRSQQGSDQRQNNLTQAEIHRWLRRSFESGTSQYAFDVTATFEGTISQRRMASNDVVTIFESLVLWYAQQVDNDTPVEEILGILLTEANVPIRYPPESVHRIVKSSNLTPEDSIGDLLEEIDDGVQF